MKIFTTTCLLLAIASVFISCEKEINLELKNTSPKLVVEGNILWGIDTVINQQELKISLSANYTGNTSPQPVTNASVMVNDGTNTHIYNHIGNGIYRSSFIAATNNTYKLIIKYGEDEYHAFETLKAGGAGIDSLSINYFPSALGSPEGNFITVNTTDPLNERNYYLWQLYINDSLMINPSPGNIYRAIQKDEFFNGQPLFNYLPFDNFPVLTGDIARLHQLNISEQMYNYYYSIFNLTAYSPVSGDVPPGKIKGNIININNPDKNALGYFGACSISITKKSIKI
ncbi:MAG: DUF4249 domain-containing protein [Bacteroidota bacterium]|jgi:hypothetical protein